MVKNSPADAGDTGVLGLIPGLRRSPRVGNGNPIQYSCLENSMDRGAWHSPWGRRVRHDWVTEHTCMKRLHWQARALHYFPRKFIEGENPDHWSVRYGFTKYSLRPSFHVVLICSYSQKSGLKYIWKPFWPKYFVTVENWRKHRNHTIEFELQYGTSHMIII